MAAMSLNAHPAAVAEAVVAVVQRAGQADLGSPTPCPDFELKGLINHLIGTTGALVRVGLRSPLDSTDPYGSSVDSTGGDWQATLSTNLDSLARVWGDTSAWEGTVDMGGHEMPAAMIAEMAMAEMALHGWDLARATGQQLTLADDVAAELRRSIEETGELGRSTGAYGPEVLLAEDGTEFERALAASGRDPRWGA
jgi:uncharacterized protein (TIGR03086 family)